jgi:hypothetical protein
MQSTREATANTAPAKSDRGVLSNRVLIGLGLLLAAQILGALALWLGGKDLSPAAATSPLLEFDADNVTAVRIESVKTGPVFVKKAQDQWIIPSLGDLPASEPKVNGLLDKLATLKKGLPVATSDDAFKRFKVADQDFERKLTLERDGGDAAVLFLGDSPGFRRLFVRAGGDRAVYEADLGLFDAPDKADEWSERTLLHLKKDDLSQLKVSDVLLARDKDAWKVANLAQGEKQDEQAVENTVRSLTTIDFLGVLDKDAKPKLDDKATPVEVTATLASGDTVRYKISKQAQGNDYLLEVSSRPQRFTLAPYVAEDLSSIKRADLLAKPQERAETPQDKAAGEAQVEAQRGNAPASPSGAGRHQGPAQGASADTAPEPSAGVPQAGPAIDQTREPDRGEPAGATAIESKTEAATQKPAPGPGAD